MTTLLERLEALEKGRTPGEWTVNGAGVGFSLLARVGGGVAVSVREPFGDVIEDARLLALSPALLSFARGRYATWPESLVLQ